MRRAQRSDATPGSSQTSSLPPQPSPARREGRPGRSGFGPDGAGPPFGADSALARLHSCLTRGAALGEWQRLEPPEPDDRAAAAADPVLVSGQTLDRVSRVLRAPAGLARPALRHPRAD